ncbi:YdcF family protein [Rhodoferax sp.]|uniref:YdcF family protein n=1 Tax=Rhodoferax sp. TaxID=50421 RepID=UPI00374D7578
MQLGELKPILTALVLPPAGPLLLVALGLLWRRRVLGWLFGIAGLVGLWLLGCNAVAVALAQTILPQVPALAPTTAASTLQAGKVQAVVVLGGGIQPSAPEYGTAQPTADTLARLRYGVWLTRQASLPLAFAGGVGWANSGNTSASEGAVARATLAQDYGLALRWVDDQSRDTAENATQMQTLLARDGIQRIALVTNAWHMPRAQAAFERAGFQVTPAPMGFTLAQQRSLLEWLPTGHGLQGSREVLREWLALRVAGR